MRRRDFIQGITAVSAAWPLAVRAQQSGNPVIGFLNSASPDTYVSQLNAFREGLKENGYVEGQNVAIEYRWAENQIAQLPRLASELVHRPVSVIAAWQPSFGYGRKIRNYNNSNCLHERCRSSGSRLGCKLQSTRRKRNRRYLAQCRARGKADGNPS